jgi:hypothetical protein
MWFDAVFGLIVSKFFVVGVGIARNDAQECATGLLNVQFLTASPKGM